MQKDLKGGYQLISLGMTPIEDIDHIDVELLKTTKRIVLTGISLDGVTQLPDKTVDIEYDGTNIILKNVYGYDITVDINGDIYEVTETPSTATQLYKHTFDLTDDDGVLWKFTLIDGKIANVGLQAIYDRLLGSMSVWCYKDEETMIKYKVTGFDDDSFRIFIGSLNIPSPVNIANSTTVAL